jgi:imidazolonepropionase-like amidohydrolase
MLVDMHCHMFMGNSRENQADFWWRDAKLAGTSFV